jgi:hypothetical protein
MVAQRRSAAPSLRLLLPVSSCARTVRCGVQIGFRKLLRAITMKLIASATLLIFATNLGACGGNGDDKRTGGDTNRLDAQREAPPGKGLQARGDGELPEKATGVGELECPHPPTEASRGVLSESPAQIAGTAKLLGEGQPAEIMAAATNIRSRHPGASPSAITNALMIAFCPTVNSRDLDLPEKKEKMRTFASRAYAATAK